MTRRNSRAESSGADTTGERFWLLAALAAFIILFIAAALYVPEYLTRRECQACEAAVRIKMLTDSRSAVIQIFAGLAGAATVYFTWRNYVRSSRDSERSFALAREARAADSFVSAVSQLAEDSPSARAGGALALGRLLRAAAPDEDYWSIMDLLTAFVRARADKTVKRLNPDKLDTDVEAAINVLARRSSAVLPERTDGDSPVDISSTDLSGGWFAMGKWQGAYFRRCDLKDADFSSSELAHASFEEADVTGANFTGAYFHRTNFSNAGLSGAQFTAVGAEMAGLTREQRAVIRIAG